MKGAMMTPSSLFAAIDASPADQPLVFRTAEGEIGPGYHLTEIRLMRHEGIDCGGRTFGFTDAVVQLMDGRGGDFMTAGKAAAILRKSLSHLTAAADVPLRVEFAHENLGLRVYEPNLPEQVDGKVVVNLGEVSAACRPMQDIAVKSDRQRTTSWMSCC